MMIYIPIALMVSILLLLGILVGVYTRIHQTALEYNKTALL